MSAGLPLGVRALLLAAVSLFVFLFTYAGLGKLIAAAAVAGALVFLVWQKPIWGIAALVLLGPLHQLLMLIVFRFAGPTFVLKAAQLWKEVVVLALLLKVIDLAFRSRKAPAVYLLDITLGMFLLFGLFYLAYPNTLQDATFISKAYGLRADAFFLVAYFVGRAFPLDTRQLRSMLLMLAAITFVIDIVAALQWIAPNATNAVFTHFGLAAYLGSQRGSQAARELIDFRRNAGVSLPRSASLLLSSLALAFYTLLAAPIAAAFLATRQKLPGRGFFHILLLATVATTAMTVTRSAILAVVPAVGSVFLKSGRLFTGALLVVELAAVGFPVAVAMHVTPTSLHRLFSLNEGSAQAHIADLEQSIAIVRHHPLGRGLGTAGGTAQLFDTPGGITNENAYLQIATEIGVFPAILFALILIQLAVVAFQRASLVTDPWVEALCLGMGGAVIGFMLEGWGLHVWDSETTSLLFWLLAGIVVQSHNVAARQLTP